jgi:GTP-binding protein
MGHHEALRGLALEEDAAVEIQSRELTVAGEGRVKAAPGADKGAGAERETDFPRWLFAQQCAFMTAAVKADQLPEMELPEVAFAGRSNVGKSSLINALTGRRALARTSRAPGRTQQINFFDLGGRLVLVDLPGYGYARVARTRVRAWTRLVEAYFRGRGNLRRLCLLVDGRHGLKASDGAVMAMLDEAAVSYQVILTKIDKVKPEALLGVGESVGRELSTHAAAHPDIIMTSAHKGNGIEALRGALATLARPAQV